MIKAHVEFLTAIEHIVVGQRLRVFELCSLYSSPNIVRVIKSRRMR
jgi:hypothetical protein